MPVSNGDFRCGVLIAFLVALQSSVILSRELFRDDFDTFWPDMQKWSTVERPSPTPATPSYASRNVYTGRSLLNLAVQRGYAGAQWTSARIHTSGKFAFKYGQLEVRARLPAGSVLANIWLAPYSCAVKDCADFFPPTIALLHFRGQQPTGGNSTLYFRRTPASASMLIFKHFAVNASLSDGFHTFKLDWFPERLVWAVDGQAYFHIYDKTVIPSVPMYLVMNAVAVADATFNGYLSPMQVDYVVVRDTPVSAARATSPLPVGILVLVTFGCVWLR
ncbi:glucan endo-1,3-beta-glucosidase A1-like [Paramacrobiotus metropolitanus]|uniref:glucan endo-1,3-beta-glucosidase A1-like n=1 Tax=Paramacrobiotus metropolitanus TaxID=2943436 RepID=UPI002445B8B6|nr:glucan endo-1,3-beta-glucosidase A1-like [Paramacrobiotus metropolitanus]